MKMREKMGGVDGIKVEREDKREDGKNQKPKVRI